MKYEEIAEKIKAILARKRNVSLEEISPDDLITTRSSPENNAREFNFSSLSGGLDYDLERISIIMAIEEEFDVEIPDEEAERLVCVRDAVRYVYEKLSERNLETKRKVQILAEAGQNKSRSPEKIIKSILRALNISGEKKFTFLLLGRTGVGKSSTINSLLGMEVAPTDPFEPMTMEVKLYKHESQGIHFTVIDTPGLCDELEEDGNNEEYLELIRSEIEHIDLVWFVTPLDETRVRSDEKRGIKLISEAFGSSLWEHSMIIFTRADKVDVTNYQFSLQKRTELIRKEISKCVDDEAIVENIPSVAVSNTCKTTPDGKMWLGELYATVFHRTAEQGALPFFLATAHRVKKAPDWKFYHEFDYKSLPNFADCILLDEIQEASLKAKLIGLIPGLAFLGAEIGSVFGPIGTAIGSVLGGGIGLIACLFT